VNPIALLLAPMPGSATMTQPKPAATPVSGSILSLLNGIKSRADEAGVFGSIALAAGRARLTLRAANAAEPAEYRVDVEESKVWVSLVTANRWLSESIETDLLHTGDKLDELIEEELAELDYDVVANNVAFEHFRSEDKLFTFRSALPIAMNEAASREAIDTATTWLLAYEACFRRLGDMDASGGEE